MPKRPRPRPTSPQRPSHPPSCRTPALLASASSLCLSGGLAALTWVWSAALERELAADAGDAVDLDGMVVVAWWAGDAAFRWAVVSAAGSLAGCLGLLLVSHPSLLSFPCSLVWSCSADALESYAKQRRSSLHRVFAVTTATDLVVTILATVALASLTLSPSLSGPFGSFLCSSTFASDWTAPARGGGGVPGSGASSSSSSSASSSWSGGTEILSWGVEACDESWQLAMVGVILGCGVAVVLRVLGTWVTWECNAEMRDQELRDQGLAWVDHDDGEDDDARQVADEAAGGGAGDAKTPLKLEETLGRPRASSTAATAVAAAAAGAARRAHTLPLPYGLEAAKRARSHTVTFGQHGGGGGAAGRHAPQLVLVPVMLDARGRPVFEPSSPTYTFPPYSHPHSHRPRQGSSSGRTTSSLGHGSSASSSRSSSRSSMTTATRPPRLRSSSSSSSSGSSSSLASPRVPLFVDEPAELSSPPCTPRGQSSSTMVGAGGEETSRRLRTRSDDVSLRSPPPF